MFVSLSAALVQACGFGEEKKRGGQHCGGAWGWRWMLGGETGQRRGGGEDDVFEPEKP